VKNEMDGGSAPPEQPILWLGMTGFDPGQRALLEASLQRPGNLPRWRTGEFRDADGLWVNGPKVRTMPDGNLKVAAGLPSEHAVNLDLSEVDRPVAFALPVASGEFEPRCTFDPGSPSSLQSVLMQFDNWLRQVRAQFVLGAQLLHRGEQLRGSIYHVTHRGSLLAVMDFHAGRAALSPTAHPADLWEAQWHKRPLGARDVPPTFVALTVGQLAWTYVLRTDRAMLPPRYRKQTIYYRHPPEVPVAWLQDSQLVLLRDLSLEAATFEALQKRTGLSERVLERDLGCLYYAGAVTTTGSKSAARLDGRDVPPGSPAGAPDSLPSNDLFARQERTAPARLDGSGAAEGWTYPARNKDR
jgi:hypothetical protein